MIKFASCIGTMNPMRKNRFLTSRTNGFNFIWVTISSLLNKLLGRHQRSIFPKFCFFHFTPPNKPIVFISGITLIISAFCILDNQYAFAKTVWCTNCSEKFTQALDRVTNVEQLRNIVADYQESVQQTIQQVRMVQQNVAQHANMVQNTIGLPAEIYGKVHGTFTRLADLTSQLRTSRGDLSAMAGIFRNIYAESDKMASLMTLPMDDLQKTVDTWGENVDRSAEALFQLSGDQLQSMVRDTPALEAHIDELLSTPEGQMQALMAANTLTSMQLQEARQLRELTATMSQAQLSSQMKGEKEDQLQKEQWRKATETGLLEELSNMELPKTF